MMELEHKTNPSVSEGGQVLAAQMQDIRTVYLQRTGIRS